MAQYSETSRRIKMLNTGLTVLLQRYSLRYSMIIFMIVFYYSLEKIMHKAAGKDAISSSYMHS